MLHVQIFIAITLWIITTAYLLIKLNNRKIFLDILNKNHEDLVLENESLRAKEYNYIVLVEKLKAQVEFLEKDALNSEKNKKDAFIAAQTSFNQVSQNLTKQLLEMQKQESKANLSMTEQVITSTVNKVKADFEKITAAMSILNSDIENSNRTHDAIKKSLLSPIATGQLAEITLVNILTSAGLKQNTDFFVQNTLLSDENNKLRPDVIFTMPDHVLIIDAKSSKFFMDFELSSSDGVNDDSAKEAFTKSMNLHLKSLAAKDYSQGIISSDLYTKEQKSNITTIMFLPTESFIERIISSDNQFLAKAWQANIFPVGPTGLMNLLLIAKKRISEQSKLENYQEILIEVEKLLDSVSVIFEHSLKLGTNLQGLVSTYDKFAASFNRNFLSKAEKLKNMGLNTKGSSRMQLKRYSVISDNNNTQELE